MSDRAKVTVLQHRLLHYRVGLFEKVRAECARRGIEVHLLHGQASPQEALKKDTGAVAWAHRVNNRFITIGGRDILWQPFPKDLRDSDLIIIMQENRILSNYPIMVRGWLGKTKVAYWGHGRNFQSDAPGGLREQWKSVLLGKVDWWFAYTGLTRKILVDHGYPDAKITCLNNAIDNDAFVADLNKVDHDMLAELDADVALGAGAPLGIYCGSLYPDKRLDLLAHAAELIHAAIPSFRLAVIGDGPSRSMLEGMLMKHNWARCVGVKRGMEKAAYFKRAKVVLSPGAVGLHVLDSFCAGVPMFTTANARHGPEIEYLEHGKNGFVLADDPKAYAEAVIGLLQNDPRYKAVSAAAKVASERYTLDNMALNFVDGIEACLGRGRAARTEEI